MCSIYTIWVNGIVIASSPHDRDLNYITSGLYLKYIKSISSSPLIVCVNCIIVTLGEDNLGEENLGEEDVGKANSSSVIPWAIVGVALAISIAIVVIIIYYKRQIDQLKQRLSVRQPAIDGRDQGSDVHLNEIHLKPERSVQGQGRELTASSPQTQHHDQADYEEVGTGIVAPPDIRHQDGAVKPDAGSGQYEGLVSDNY